MARPRDERQKDLLRPALDQIIDLGHPLARLAGEIDWGFLDQRFASVCAPGHPGLPTRLVAGLFVLKHMHNLSDEALCARWLENPYYQYFCGALSFCHKLPFDRSSLTRWRQRLGEEPLVALIQESLSVTHKTGAIETKDLERVVVDTTVQPKAIAHPTDARLMHRALEKLVRFAKADDVELRQSYLHIGKRAAIMIGRYAHAHQFKRMRRALKFLRTRLSRVIRDIRRKIADRPDLQARFNPLLDLATKVSLQDHRQRGPKVYSLHAPEVECIGKMSAPAKAGGYRGHNHPNKFRVWISGQVRRVTASIRREMKRRAAVEPVIGHIKAEHRMDRNYLKGRDGDRINPVLAAAGYNFSLMLRWLAALLRALIAMLINDARCTQIA